MTSEQLIAGMIRAVNLTARPFTRELDRRHGITLNEWRCLRALDGASSQDSAGYLAEQTGLDKMSTSRAVNSLERKRLITRERSNVDRRRFQIRLSPPGQKLIDTLKPTAQARADVMLSPLNEKQRKALTEALDLIIGRAQQED